MKKLYLAGIALEKDLEFCELLNNLENTKGVYIIGTPDQHEVVEMRYINNYNHDREETGETHIGYDYHYVSFVYRGYIFHIDAASYYPFTDENNPGMWNFVVYRMTSRIGHTQATYSEAYNGIESIDKFLDTHGAIRVFKDVYERSNTWHINRNIEKVVAEVTELRGGFREKEIFNKPCFIVESDTWSDEHKVVNIVSTNPDEGGHRDSYSVDLITQKICG